MLNKILFHIRKWNNHLKAQSRLSGNILYRSLRKMAGRDQLTPEQIRQIPIIINNFNRLDCLKQLIHSLEKHNLTNILILDNHSTYPPLLEYYATCPYPVHRLDENLGFLAFWKCGLYQEKYASGYYVLTDPDVVPDESCPLDFMQHFYNLLQHYPGLDKVGFSLRIDNIPNHYDKKAEVIQVEGPYWEKPVNNQYYAAPVDTTFALYRPGVKGGFWLRAGRTFPPYTALHLPWYADSANPDAETLYYRNQAVYSKNWS